MSHCSMCGSSIPDGQRVCSMCYGDIDYGKDGYYRDCNVDIQKDRKINRQGII